jgi:chloramphenicol O-acetyltransferase type B
MFDLLKKRFFKKEKPPKIQRGTLKFKAKYPNFEFGIGSYGIPEVHDWSQGTVLRVGAYTSIADDVHIFLGGNHRTDWLTSFPFPALLPEAANIEGHNTTRGDVIIGNDVWLGSGSTILSGVIIGNGAVVAARAVVTRHVEPYAIVGGNPAKFIRWRFDEKTRSLLNDSAWWTWPEDEIKKILPILCSDKVDEFAEYLASRTTG